MTNARVIFHPTPVNMRLSPEKLATFIKESGNSINSGDIYLFFNRERDRCKIVWHDGEGFNTLEKVLQEGRFAANDKIKIKSSAIHNLLYGGIEGQKELLHSLLGNVLYLEDARKRGGQ